MKYLDDTGLGYFWNKIKNKPAAEAGTDLSLVTTNDKYVWNNKSDLVLGETETTAFRGDKGKTAALHASLVSGNPHNVTASDVGLGNVGNFKAVSTVASQGLTDTEKSNARSNIGAGTSSLTLGETSSTAYFGDKGKTAYNHSQITGNPHGTTKAHVGLSNVGNFLAVSTVASQGLTETQKYNARTNIGAGTSSLALGETSGTAYRGDRGALAYSHAVDSNRITTVTASGLYKVGSTAQGHIASLTAVEKSDITDLGIPAQDTTYESKAAASGGTDVSLVTTGEKYNWNRLTTDLLNKLTYIGTSTAVSGTYKTAAWAAGTATNCTWSAPRDGKYIVYAYFKNHDDSNNQGKVYKQFQLRGTATKEVANPILYQVGTSSTSSTDSPNAAIMGVQGSTFVTATTGQTIEPYIHTPVANIVWDVKIVGVYIG